MMELMTQFSVFLVNKPGILAQVSRKIAQFKINLVAMTMMDSSEHGVLRLVATDAKKLRTALTELNLPITETEVLLVEMSNKPGALADICGKLAAAHININYAYCTTGIRSGKTKGIFKVAHTQKAVKVLGEKKRKRSKKNKQLRRPAVLR